MPIVLKSLQDPPLIKLLQKGAVGVLPTDTIYGLVCRAADEEAVKRLYKLKNREHKPGTVIAANIEQLIQLGIKARYVKAVEQYWPSALSIIIPNLNLTYLHVGLEGLAVRVPNYRELLLLLEQIGPLLTTSANYPGRPPANTIEEAKVYFADRVDFYVDGGNLSNHQPSTLIRIVDDEIEVLRPGAVTIDETGKII